MIEVNLTIEQFRDPMVGGEFSGSVEFLEENGETYKRFCIFPFIWTESEDLHGWPRGWKPATSTPIPLRDDYSWYIHVAPARQSAALLVPEDFAEGFHPNEPFAPGTLPIDG